MIKVIKVLKVKRTNKHTQKMCLRNLIKGLKKRVYYFKPKTNFNFDEIYIIKHCALISTLSFLLNL